MSRYRLFPRDLKAKDGSSSRVWYYEYLGPDGGRVRRSTGYTRKRDAEDFIESLDAQDEAEEERAKTPSRPRARLREVADPMFKADSAHIKRWAQKGRKLVAHTIEQHRRWIDLFIMPKWGEVWCDEITGPAIEDWLITLTSSTNEKRGRGPGLANTTKNGIGRTMGLILTEAKRAGYIDQVPELELFERNSQKKDIVLDAELEKLFPECPAALSLVWMRRPNRNRDAEGTDIGLMFGALFALAVSAGLRPGEARALHVDQLYRDAGGIIVDRAYDTDGTLGAPKKSKAGDPRFRVSFVPERTWKIIDLWLKHRKAPEDHPGLLFPFHGKPISSFFLNERFGVGLENAEIPTTGRILSPHSLRYTYDTKMRSVLSGDVLREFIGHRSEAMTDHYDRASLRPVLEMRLFQLEDQRPLVEQFWVSPKLSCSLSE
jgi:integrase